MTEILFASSFDDKFEPQNILTNNKNFWTSTGLYPQELIIQLDSNKNLNSVNLSSYGIRNIIIETCETESAGNFVKQAEMVDVPITNGKLQEYFLNFSQSNSKVKIMKIKVLSGYEDFCSIHNITFK